VALSPSLALGSGPEGTDWHWHWAPEQPAQSWHPCHLTCSPTEVRRPQFYVVGIAGPANHERLIFKCSEARILSRKVGCVAKTSQACGRRSAGLPFGEEAYLRPDLCDVQHRPPRVSTGGGAVPSIAAAGAEENVLRPAPTLSTSKHAHVWDCVMTSSGACARPQLDI
jgi:hypothetical protein